MSVTADPQVAEAIRRFVDDWPPLTPAQRDDLAVLLRPVRRRRRRTEGRAAG